MCIHRTRTLINSTLIVAIENTIQKQGKDNEHINIDSLKIARDAAVLKNGKTIRIVLFLFFSTHRNLSTLLIGTRNNVANILLFPRALVQNLAPHF